MQTICAAMLVSAAVGGPAEDTYEVKLCVVTHIKEIDVPAREKGIISSMEVKLGSHVKAGKTQLFKVDDEDTQYALQMTQAQLESAEMLANDTVRLRAARAQSEVSRYELLDAQEANARLDRTFSLAEMRKREFTAKRDRYLIEKEQNDRQMAEVDVKSKRAELSRAEAMIRRHSVVAPFDGEVIQIYRHAHEWVNPGEPILRLVHMDKLLVTGLVPSDKFSRHEIKGKDVTIAVTSTGGGVERFTGEITYVSAEVEGDSFRVGAEIDNKKSNDVWVLNPGLSATMTLDIGLARGASNSSRR